MASSNRPRLFKNNLELIHCVSVSGDLTNGHSSITHSSQFSLNTDMPNVADSGMIIKYCLMKLFQMTV